MAVGADGNNKLLVRFRLDQPTVNRLRSYAAVRRRSVDNILEEIIVNAIGNSSSGSGSSMEQHALCGSYHTGQLDT